MIRPASEIEFPPSEAMCLKARMIARMERIAGTSESIVTLLSERFGALDPEHLAEIEAFTAEQKRLVDNMKRIVRG